ncbi:MAG: cardiolipin synthase [Lachnospiraceae bacterium]|nr:cardiolipin synthase [Lachnospiraceae bacterium]
MKKRRNKLLKIIFSRTIVFIILLFVQLAVLFSVCIWMQDYMVYLYGGFTALAFILTLYIINREDNPDYKLAWIIPILVFPVFGGLFYLFIKCQLGSRILNHLITERVKETRPYLKQQKEVMEKLRKEDRYVANLATYMNSSMYYPIYQNTDAKFFSLGEDKFEEMKIQLKKAKKFIFMEYFIVEEGKMWNEVLEILEQKVQEGVEVRFMYDGTCSLFKLPHSYPSTLQKKGIKCKLFAPIKPALSTYQNNRDHRKILVIDGHTAFTGGVNLADEYINAISIYGHWKDTAIMIQGEAVKSFTLMFLQLWDVTEEKPQSANKFIENIDYSFVSNPKGYFMPYCDSPLDNENVGELVYLDLINTAKEYVHIMTPYLILDHEFITALTYAAKRGVEVSIIMPHIPDKKTAFYLAKTYYKELLPSGVKIYEYLPGFIHAKEFIVDGQKAVVGSINLDYRSLYLNFECGVFLYQNDVILDMEKDFQETLRRSLNITMDDHKKLPIHIKLIGSMLRFIAPLM